MTLTICTLDEFNAEIEAIGPGVPDAEGHKRLSLMTIHHPAVDQMNRLDPFSQAYRDAALGLYLDLRGRQGDGYEPARDEKSNGLAPLHLFSDVSPWVFQDTTMVAEFLESWAQILRAMALPAYSNASVLEYGPGSGQLLLMLARMGLRAHGVDIDQPALDSLHRQAEVMGLKLRTERAEFGEGFTDERFDRIFFFEAFHHAFDFEALLRRLQDRVTPGGRLIFCGEPVVTVSQSGIPYAWGPRLDALSVFCMRRYGWMELGFTHDFFMEALHRNGWYVEFSHPPNCGRAWTYVAQRLIDRPAENSEAPPPPPLVAIPPSLMDRAVRKLRRITGF
jgi:2-polyprenyl-3-methyl-5-hydroxy-6-metoxy-1,4-benzoquinol methylase